MRTAGITLSTLRGYINDALNTLVITGGQGYSVTLKLSEDPWDPTEGGRLCIDGAYVVLMDVVEGGGQQITGSGPREQWHAVINVEIVITTALRARRDIHRNEIDLVGSAVIDAVDAKLHNDSLVLSVTRRTLPRPQPVPGKNDYQKTIVRFTVTTPWERTI